MSIIRTRTALPLLLIGLALVVVALAGCGGGGGDESAGTTATTETTTTETETTTTTESTPEESGDATAGKQVFADAGCGGCHTLAAAGSTGAVGPNLDNAKPSHDLVVDRVTNGMGAMPSFDGQLSETQIQDVAAYVVASTSG